MNDKNSTKKFRNGNQFSKFLWKFNSKAFYLSLKNLLMSYEQVFWIFSKMLPVFYDFKI